MYDFNSGYGQRWQTERDKGSEERRIRESKSGDANGRREKWEKDGK